MINFSAIPHPIPTLFVAFDILNSIESHKVISQLQQIARLHGTTVRINLKTTGGNILSLLKPPEIHETDISQALAIADASISPHYLANPKRTALPAACLSGTSQDERHRSEAFQGAERQGNHLTKRVHDGCPKEPQRDIQRQRYLQCVDKDGHCDLSSLIKHQNDKTTHAFMSHPKHHLCLA